MLALMVLVEIFVGRHRSDIVSPSAEDWRFAAWAAARKAPGADLLCFGDSLVKYGVLPKVIEARTGWKSYNLATSGGTMPSEYLLLKQALAAGARPKAIVADFAALMLDDPVPTPLLHYPELATVSDSAGLAWVSGDASLGASLLLAKLLPSFRWRFEVRDLVMANLQGQIGSKRAFLRDAHWRWEANLGAQPMPPGRVRHPSEDYLIDGVSPASWAVDPRGEVYLDKFLTLARSQQIPVYWLIPPLVPEAHSRRARRGTDAAYDRLVRSKLSQYPNVVVLDARQSGYDDSVHIDHIHLDRIGATALSVAIGTVIDRRPQGKTAITAWVTLPTFSSDPPTESLARERGPVVR